MIEDLQKYLEQVMARVDGLHCIIITDREGVPIIQVASDTELPTRPSFLATYTTASDQASKLSLGKNRYIITMFSKYQLIQLNKSPLIINFVADIDSNTGLILTLEEYIDPILKDVTSAINVG